VIAVFKGGISEDQNNDWFSDYIDAGSEFLDQQAVESIERLAKHAAPRVRRRLAENSRCPQTILERLSRDSDAEVRSAVAANPATPVDLVFALALDVDATVRYAMAEDVSLPAGVLRLLSRDDNPYVSCRARKTLALLRRKWRRSSEHGGQNVIGFPGTGNADDADHERSA